MMFVMPTFSPVRSGLVSAGDITLVAGDRGGGHAGYAIEAWEGIDIGTISAEPIVGVTLALFMSYSYGYTEMDFLGDAAGFLTGKTMYINGAPYPFAGATYPPEYFGEFPPEYTWIGWEGAGRPIFAAGASYTIRIE